ncbi:uncharacterized protein O9250_005046 isoform 3-T4 [Rhynochetos jubatus]
MACLYAWFHCMVPQTALPAWSRANSSAQGWGEERLPELMLLPTEMSGAGAKQSGSKPGERQSPSPDVRLSHPDVSLRVGPAWIYNSLEALHPSLRWYRDVRHWRG